MSREATPPLVIELLGPFVARVDGMPLPPLRSRKGQWLLSLLVLRAGREVGRDWLSSTLWPSSPPAAAFVSLRNSLLDLRRALGRQEDRLRCPTPHVLALDLSGAVVDVLAFDAAIAAGEPATLDRAVSLYRGPLLEGCVEEWVIAERQAREQNCLWALETLADRAQLSGDRATAERYLRRAIAIDPLRESAQRELMLLLMSSGNEAAARQVYRALCRVLHREAGVLPDAETEAVFRRLRPVAPSKGSAPGNAPLALTPLVGRAGELEAVCRLLRPQEANSSSNRVRLLTLTGTAGVGKTRLALEVAAELQDAFEGGVSYVALAGIQDTGAVLHAVATSLGVRDARDATSHERLLAFLGQSQRLVVLDNFEHLLPAAPEIGRLLAAPGLSMLVTSRAPLRLHGEHELPLLPLKLPPTCERAPHEYPAVQLFVQRAQAVKPGFYLTEVTAPDVVEICRRLDGLPLAIELAAARIRLLSPKALLGRLDHRLKLLTRGPVDLAHRHQTLRNAIAWSYDLLDEGEKELFRHLSVFAGGASLKAIEVVCCKQAQGLAEGAKDGSPDGLLDNLMSLIEHSMLVQSELPDGEPRFGMLDTLREFGRERLRAESESEVIHRRHAEFFLSLAQARPREGGGHGDSWLRRLEEELDNLRAALAWCLRPSAECHDPEAAAPKNRQSVEPSKPLYIGLELAVALDNFWKVGGYLREGRKWLLEAVEQTQSETHHPSRTRALTIAAALAAMEGEFSVARRLGQEALAYQLATEDRAGMADSLNSVASAAAQQGEYEVAHEHFAEAIALSRALGDRYREAMYLQNLGLLVRRRGDIDQAWTLYEEADAIDRELGRRRWAFYDFRGFAALTCGDLQTAREQYQVCLEMEREKGDQRGIAYALEYLGKVATRAGELDTARSLHQQSLRIRQTIGQQLGIAISLEALGVVAVAAGDMPAAVRLLSSGQATRNAAGAQLPPADRSEVESARAVALHHLGEADFAAAWAEGGAMTLQHAVAFALSEPDA